MTRQKKEIEKWIEEIQRFIEVDQELGCGFAPANAYEKEEHECYRLYEQLAHLRHYESVEAMMYDCRGQEFDGIPWRPVEVRQESQRVYRR